MPSIGQWQQAWTRMGVSQAPKDVFDQLLARYSEPHRAYHTLRHLDECFEKLAELRTEAIHIEEIEIAIWFHDAIYDVSSSVNEQKSAEWAKQIVATAGASQAAAERIYALVMVTCHNAMPRGMDETILVDVDLSILGASPDRFDEYERQVRQEYAWVPETMFRSERRKILKEFLNRRTIYNTKTFIARYEAQARINLERSVKNLAV